MSDEFTEYTDAPGCFEKLKDSIAKLGIGILMIIISFPLLFWNEGRAVKRAQDLAFGRGSVESVDASTASAKAGALVHVSGKVTPTEPAVDSQFKLGTKPMGISRSVEMYQWKENKKTTQKKKKKKTTYTYEKTWSSSEISSANFKKSKKHTNPGFPSFSSETFYAKTATLGAYKLDASLIKKWPISDAYTATDKDLAGVKNIGGYAPVINAGAIYFGTADAPTIGDVRVTFKVGTPGEATIVSGVEKGTLTPFSHADMNGTIGMLEMGTKSSDAMFTAAEDSNAMMTWILRVVGLFLMFMGFNLLFGPLDTLFRMIPLLGGVLDFGTTLIAGLLAFGLSFITIAIGWIFYRPLIGILLLLVGFAAIGGIIFLAIKAKKKSS